jgi:hypothetical protein
MLLKTRAPVNSKEPAYATHEACERSRQGPTAFEPGLAVPDDHRGSLDLAALGHGGQRYGAGVGRLAAGFADDLGR